MAAHLVICSEMKDFIFSSDFSGFLRISPDFSGFPMYPKIEVSEPRKIKQYKKQA